MEDEQNQNTQSISDAVLLKKKMMQNTKTKDENEGGHTQRSTKTQEAEIELSQILDNL